MKPLTVYQEEIKGKKCRWCGKDLGDELLEFYDHDGGFEVEGFDRKQWLYVTCPECEYQWSLSKLLR